MSDLMIDFKKWDRVGNKYIYPLTPEKNNWYNIGLVPFNDYTADVYGWYGFAFTADLHGEEEIVVTAGVLAFSEINAQEIEDTITWRATVCGDGPTRIVAPLEQFELPSCMPAKWRFLRSVEISRPVTDFVAVKGRSLSVDCGVLSRSAEPGETIEFEIKVLNCLDKKQAVSFEFAKEGWEVLEPQADKNPLILEPFEEGSCRVSFEMKDDIVEGGFEKHKLFIIPNGDGAAAETVELYPVRRLPHPYISGTEKDWDEIKQKAIDYKWAADKKEFYVKRAEEWQVPKPAKNANYLFITENAHLCYNAAIAWKLTGRREFAEKSAEFLRRVAAGYPEKRKACHQQLVHEGEFFKSCAFAYDLIHDLDVISEADHEAILHAFRLFVNFLDWALSDGGISNWSLAEIAGALYCAMNLQDRERIDRFIYGVGGILAHLRAGVLSDGWWCECTIGYNQMAAGLFSEYTLALRPWGINLAQWWVPAQYSKHVQMSNTHADGLCWDIYGGNTKNYRAIEDLWDSLVAMANYRSVVQGVNDSAEEVFEGASRVAFDSRYDIAYALYGKPEYAAIIKNAGDGVCRDLIHGVAELPDAESSAHRQSCYFGNAGITVLRTRTPGRSDSEQLEVGVKYGSHGGAHGHYDRTALNAVSRNGRSLFNPENIWYSYGTYMYKFFVQNSITHNMVTVDLKLQDPQEGAQPLFHAGELFQASVVENTARWSNPPYGGWRVRSDESFADRTWTEGRYLPVPEDAPEYTKRSEFTEPVTLRRAVVVTDDYTAVFDCAEGSEEHDFDCIYHLKGLDNIEGAEKTGYSRQLTDNLLSSGQFITEVDRYGAEDGIKLSFSYEYGEKESAKAGWMTPFRSGHNIPGTQYTDLYYIGGGELLVGNDPEFYMVAKKLWYSVRSGDEVLADGKFGAWMFGRGHVDVDVSGRSELSLHVKTEDGIIDHNNQFESLKTIFWGDPYFETADGGKIYLADMAYETENVDGGFGAGVDYEGGPVKIEQEEYKRAVPGDGVDRSKESVIKIDLSGIDAVRFVTDIGGDYPVGVESRRRKFVSLRRRTKKAEFISLLETYDKEGVISGVKSSGDHEITVSLKDGREQIIRVSGLDGSGDINIEVKELKNGRVIREEYAENEL